MKYWNKPYIGPIKPALTGVQLGSIKAGKLKVNDNDKAYLEALHDGEITESDAVFATFIDDLKTAGVYDKSAVVVVSDHGDQFYEHGSVGHGDSVYQELTHVPLIIRAPGLFPKGKVVKADVEITDVYATMLELAGIKPDPTMQGTSLRAARDRRGRPQPARRASPSTARSRAASRWRATAWCRTRRRSPSSTTSSTIAASRRTSPADRPIALRQMRGVLRGALRLRAEVEQEPLGHRRERHARVLQRHRALASGPSCAAPSSRPSPVLGSIPSPWSAGGGVRR